eukprot:3140775-Karenia_brevis.AAC.1
MQPNQAQSVVTMRSKGLLRKKGRSRGGAAPWIEFVLAGSGAYFLRPVLGRSTRHFEGTIFLTLVLPP